MTSTNTDFAAPADATHRAEPILALDVGSAREALELADRLPRADFVKIGLQLYIAAGPDIVRELRARGRRVFLDLKLHDIPTTVAGAVESAAALGVELLTVHTAGGTAMLRAARTAANRSPGTIRLLGVTVLTSLSADELAEAWGRERLRIEGEVVRLACLARDEELDGVVASVREVAALRRAVHGDLRVLTPGIRLAGDSADDQARVATPTEAVRLGADYIVVGRTVTAAADPVEAYERVLAELASAGAKGDPV
jgi:orotidine-5'-phosphate decarboxylase